MRNFFQNRICRFVYVMRNFSKIQTPILFTLHCIFSKSEIQIQDLFSICVIFSKSKFQICLRYASFFQNPNSNPIYVTHYISKMVNNITLLILQIKIVLIILTSMLKFPKILLNLGIYNIPKIQCSAVHLTLFWLDLCYSGVKCNQPSSLSWSIRWILLPTSAVTGQR